MISTMVCALLIEYTWIGRIYLVLSKFHYTSSQRLQTLVFDQRCHYETNNMLSMEKMIGEKYYCID